MNQLRKRFTYANVMSSLAVFLVLGGGAAVAAGQLGKNTVGSKQLKKNAVTAAKIKNNSVTAAKIKNGAVSGAKIDTASLGTVPTAGHANTAGSATKANTAENAKTANTANSAATANSANTANSAGSVNGQTIHKVAFRTTSDTGTVGPETVFNAGGFAITVTCTNGGAKVEGTTTKGDSSFYANVFDQGTDNLFFQEEEESGEFDVGDTVDLLAGQTGNNQMSIFEYDAVDGSVATGIINTDENGALNGCRVTGHVTVG